MTRNAIFTICWAQMMLCPVVQEVDCAAGLSAHRKLTERLYSSSSY